MTACAERKETSAATTSTPATGPRAQNEARPKAKDPKQRGSGRLQGKVVIITGGDSGIGRAFAKEGADFAVIYLEEHTVVNG